MISNNATDCRNSRLRRCRRHSRRRRRRRLRHRRPSMPSRCIAVLVWGSARACASCLWSWRACVRACILRFFPVPDRSTDKTQPPEVVSAYCPHGPYHGISPYHAAFDFSSLRFGSQLSFWAITNARLCESSSPPPRFAILAISFTADNRGYF